MKTILQILVCLVIGGMQAQTTHDLDWERGMESPETDLTIDVGDTVRWTWTDDLPHTVENNTGSTETFNSGVLTGLGVTYSYTFTQEGTNPYFCLIHGANNMSGVITVQQGLSVDEFENNKIVLSPNPVRNSLNITMSNDFSNGTIAIYSLIGKEVMAKKYETPADMINIDVSNFQSGVYIVRFEMNDRVETKRIIIK